MFEKHPRIQGARYTYPYVSYYKGAHSFSFNTGALRKYNLTNFKYCNLYYDRDTKTIAFEFLTKPSKSAYKVVQKASSVRNILVYGQSLLDSVGIDPALIKKLPIKEFDNFLTIKIEGE